MVLISHMLIVVCMRAGITISQLSIIMESATGAVRDGVGATWASELRGLRFSVDHHHERPEGPWFIEIGVVDEMVD